MSNLLYFYGMCGVVKELLLKRYFSKVGTWAFILSLCTFIFPKFGYLNVWNLNLGWQDIRGSAQVPESDVVQACRRVSPLALYYFLSYLDELASSFFPAKL